MITPLDDYAIHQTPEPVSRPASSIPSGADARARELEGALRVHWKAGTRHPAGGQIDMQPLAKLLTKGIGYHHPQWGHGLWKGELAVGHERYRPEELDPLRPEHVHVHQILRARMAGPDCERRDIETLETMCFGPHAPPGLHGFLDGAPAGRTT